MAKKQEEFNYGSKSLPTEAKSYTLKRTNYNGINYRDKFDSGKFSYVKNMSTAEAPYLTPSKAWIEIQEYNKGESSKDRGDMKPKSLHMINGKMYVTYNQTRNNSYNLYVDRIDPSNKEGLTEKGWANKYTGLVTKGVKLNDNRPRQLVQFNSFTNTEDVINGYFDKHVLVFPDAAKMPFDILQYDNVTKYIYDDVENKIVEKNTGTQYSTFEAFYEAFKGHIDTAKFYCFVRWKDEVTAQGKTIITYYKFAENADGTPKIVEIGEHGISHTKEEFGNFDCVPLKVEIKTFSRKCTTDYNITTDTEWENLSGDDDNPIWKTYYRYDPFEYDGEDKGVFVPIEWSKDNKDSNPSDDGWYEKSQSGMFPYYEKTTDIVAEPNKAYYAKMPVTYVLKADDPDNPFDVDVTYTSNAFRQLIEKSKATQDKPQYDYTVNDDISGEDWYVVGNGCPTDDMDKRTIWYNTVNKTTWMYSSDKNQFGNTFGWVSVGSLAFPTLDYATVYLSRLFGVKDGKIYASAFNNYANWVFDVGDDYNENSSWCSATGANTRADGEFTAIVPYSNTLVVFKEDYMQEIYNKKNPFSIQDVYAEGCLDWRTIQEVGGILIFVSRNGVMAYSGSKPREMSYEIGIDNYKPNGEISSGNDGRFYYLFYNGKEYVYDTKNGSWSVEYPENEIMMYAYDYKYGFFKLAITDEHGHGAILKQSKNKYSDDWAFATDVITTTQSGRSSYQSFDTKHVQKIQINYEMDKDAWFKVYLVKNDDYLGNEDEIDEDELTLLADIEYDSKGIKTVNVDPRLSACWGYRLYVKGSGYVKFYDIQMSNKYGGEMMK